MPFTLPQALQLLTTAHSSGRMPHALLITGSVQAGTHRLALALAQQLNGAEAEALENLRHPMCRVIRPGSKIRTITIESVRSVEPFLTLRADEGQTKMVIVAEADRMSEDSANAFLKTLEEPPPQTLIVLITELPDRLLPTILSRCVRLDMAAQGHAVQLSAAQKRFLPMLETALSHLGSDVAALALRADFQELLAECRDEITARITSALKAEAKLISEGTDIRDWEARQKDTTAAMIETEYLGTRQQMLELITLCLGQAVLLASHAPDVEPVSPVSAQVATRHSVAELLLRMKAVEQLRKDISFNVQEALILEARFTQIIGSSPL